jgi:hypothetical protein
MARRRAYSASPAIWMLNALQSFPKLSEAGPGKA